MQFPRTGASSFQASSLLLVAGLVFQILSTNRIFEFRSAIFKRPNEQLPRIEALELFTPSNVVHSNMATMDYVDIPSCATRLESSEPSSDIRPATKILTGLPNPDKTPKLTSPSSQPLSPSKIGFNFQQMLLSSALPISTGIPSSPRVPEGTAVKLLTTRDPLSIPITTVNFRRFVSKSGPIFWLQDRFEEILLWKKGWEYTLVWMAAYAFLCRFHNVHSVF